MHLASVSYLEQHIDTHTEHLSLTSSGIKRYGVNLGLFLIVFLNHLDFFGQAFAYLRFFLHFHLLHFYILGYIHLIHPARLQTLSLRTR